MAVIPRGRVVEGSVLLVVLALEALGLRSGTVGIVIVGLIAAIAVAVVAFRVELKNAGMAAALLCAFTLTWNGWFLGPVRPGDLLILVTILLFLLANPNGAFRTPPWWIKQLAVAVLVVLILTILFPPSAVYESQRVVLGATGQPAVSYKGSLVGANLGIAFKFVVAVFATPMAFAGAALVDRRAVRWLGTAFAVGAALSGFAATADHFGANVGHLITRLPNIGSRQVGFTTQPNFLAAGVVIAIPFAFWLTVSTSRRDRLLGIACLVSLLGGVYASGSRGGAVSAVLVLGLCVVLFPRTRVHAPLIGLGGLVLIGVIAGLVPSIGAQILKVTRLAGGAATQGSDTVRKLVGDQGVRDFLHSPLHGIGLQVSFDASQVYKQELASGGLILFIAMQTYMIAGIITAWRRRHENELAIAICAALVITLALNYFEANLTDRFYYVPAAILVALITAGRAHADEEPPGDLPAGEPPPQAEPATAAHPAVPATRGDT